MRYLLIAFLLLATIITKSQEKLSSLEVNPCIYKNNVQLLDNGKVLYFLIDTLSITSSPIIDDFSSNKYKSYKNSNYTFTDSTAYSFSYNGAFNSSIKFMTTKSWYLSYNVLTGKQDSVEKPSFQVVLYNNTFNPFIPNDTIEVWPIYYTYTYDSITGAKLDSSLVQAIDINNKITEPVSLDTVNYSVANYDNNSLWVDSYTFLNNTYPINPISIGVATFDGLNENGLPYNFTYASAYGIADYLTSKPINLKYNQNDSVYLSFYYQPQGNGNAPQEKDSLVLQYYSPLQKEWVNIWSTTGSENQNFKRVHLNISENKFLQNGFRFRFYNYATLSGCLDHWNIDYVILGKDRTMNDTVIEDAAFIYQAPSILKNSYIYMPYKHFKTNPSSFIADNNQIKIYNNRNAITNINYNFYVYDNSDNQICYYQNTDNVAANSEYTFTPNIASNISITTSDNIYETFKVVHTINASTDHNHNNDTIVFYQKFENYYAYDDGTPEAGYGVQGMGGMVAYKFSSPLNDTLTGAYMFFNPVVNDVSNKPFLLTVWGDNGGSPGSILAQNENALYPIYGRYKNQYDFYKLENELIVNGTFYIGWVQSEEDILNVGFDVNNDASSNVFYNTTGAWNNSQFPGSLLIRPVFGDSIYVDNVNEIKKKDNIYTIYPNPANSFISIDNFNEEYANISIFNVFGQELIKTNNPRNINISNLSKGVYFIKIIDKDNNLFSSLKFIKQ